MKPLTEGVHFERITFTPGKLTRGPDDRLWYTAYSGDGETVVLRPTHPDVEVDDIASLGRQMNLQRQARNGRHRNP